VVVEASVTNSNGYSTTCLLQTKVHNNSDFQATGVRVEANIAGQTYPGFTTPFLRLNGPTAISAYSDASYDAFISTAVTSGDPLRVTVNLLVDDQVARSETAPNFLYCTY
jgi:hypothetical protein